MSAEWLTAIASLLTLVIFAVAAFAALRQIRHMRSGNQVAALLPLVERYREAEVQASLNYVLSSLRTDMEDPEVRDGVRAIPVHGKATAALGIFNFYESIGALVCANTLDLELVLRYFNTPLDMWTIGEQYIAVSRETRGDEVFENFEAMVVLQQDFERRHGVSMYPKGMRRLVLPPPRP
ncbi:MAG TPA: hypothetical protein VIG46_01635 [Candidatus Baltobacteraceae bacterium]|jgi:hypothetical protein